MAFSRTELVIVQNETTVNIVYALVEMSRYLNGSNRPALIYPEINGQPISSSNPIVPILDGGVQAEFDLVANNFDRRYRHAIFKYKLANSSREYVTGPYRVHPGPATERDNEASNARFFLQIRLAVKNPDNEYVQVQIEDVRRSTGVEQLVSTDEPDPQTDKE